MVFRFLVTLSFFIASISVFFLTLNVEKNMFFDVQIWPTSKNFDDRKKFDIHFGKKSPKFITKTIGFWLLDTRIPKIFACGACRAPESILNRFPLKKCRPKGGEKCWTYFFRRSRKSKIKHWSWSPYDIFITLLYTLDTTTN